MCNGRDRQTDGGIMIQVAKNAGFCFGVDRAVSATYEQLKESGKKLFTLGEIIHNEQVIADLEKKGVDRKSVV